MTHQEFIINITTAKVASLKAEVERGEEIVLRFLVLNKQRFMDKKEKEEWAELEKHARNLGK